MYIFIKELFFKKEIKYYFFIFILLSFFMLAILNGCTKTNQDISDKTNYYTNRELNVLTDDSMEILLEKTKSISNIIKIYENTYIEGLFLDNKFLLATFIEEKNLNIILGNKPTSEWEVILPQKYRAHYNSTIEIIIEEQIYSFKVVGLHGNENDIIFVFNSLPFKNSEMFMGYNILINQEKNVSKVIEELYKKNYQAGIFDKTNDVYKLTVMRKLFFILLIILFFTWLVINYFIIKNIFFDDLGEISVLIAVGYKIKKILLIYLLKIFILLFLSLLISLLLLAAVKNIIDSRIYLLSIIITGIILIVVLLCDFIFLKKLLYQKSVQTLENFL